MGEITKLETSSQHILDTYVAYPSTKPQAGLVVVQEIFGLNQHIKAITDRFAKEQKYVVIAPSLFDRLETEVALDYSQESLAKGRILRSTLGWNKPLEDINTAREFVASFQKSQYKVGIIGFCWGGSLAWLSACRLPFYVSVCYYGGQIAQFAEEYPLCPTMIHFGSHDSIIPRQDREIIIGTHPSTAFYIYDAGHGFNCNERDDFQENCANQAWTRTKNFLSEYLT